MVPQEVMRQTQEPQVRLGVILLLQAVLTKMDNVLLMGMADVGDFILVNLDSAHRRLELEFHVIFLLLCIMVQVLHGLTLLQAQIHIKLNILFQD